LKETEVIKVTEFIETTAVSILPQPDFINAACEVKTTLDVYTLLSLTQDIEKKMGRKSKGAQDPRIIDIDILFYNNEIISEDHLEVPHPRLHEREFVLKSLLELCPNREHPIFNESILQLASQLNIVA